MEHQAKHILIVDDEEHFRYGVAVALRKAGFKVSEARDGSEALSKICHSDDGDHFDLIVLDIQMPKLTGNELLEVLRMNGFSIPVLFVTGYADTEIIERLKRMGPLDILNKPFAPSELVSRVYDRVRGPDVEGSRTND